MKILFLTCLGVLLFPSKSSAQTLETTFSSGVSMNGIPTYNVSQTFFPKRDVTPFGVNLGLIVSPQGLHINPNLLLNVINIKYFKLNLSIGGIYHFNKGFITPDYKRDWDVTVGLTFMFKLNKKLSGVVSYTHILPDPIRLRQYGDYAKPIIEAQEKGGQLCVGISYQLL